MAKTFFIGCTHFGHKNIINLAKRPFASVEEMDATLIENWNKTVKPGDTVIHLGDFGYHGGAVNKQHPGVAMLDKLNGSIRKLQGNHDPFGWGFDLLELRDYGRRIVCCHYPFEEWNGWYRGAIHIHAHTHKYDLISAERRFNVSVEAVNFTPISLDEIMDVTKQWA